MLASACVGGARASVALAPAWQLQATRTNAVPATVLHDAAAITIGIVDTGADLTAPDLAPRNVAGWNTRTATTDVHDTNGHGTFVASIAADSSGDAQLLIVKAGSDGGSFTDLDEAAAIVYAIDHGALVVTPSGNDFGAGNPVEYPAALLQPVGSNGVGGAGLAVTASSTDGRRAVFANTGSWVSLAAPGDHVFSAVSASSSPTLYPRTTLPGAKTGLYGYGSGTSFAAPQVAGAAALVWAANPALTAQQVAQILKETASGTGHWTPDLGFGIVNVAAAVARAQVGGPVGVLLSGRRDKGGKVKLAWSGDAASYTLTVATDGRTSSALLASTKLTSTTLSLKTGHTYVFGITALDPTGAPLSSSTLTLR